MTRRRTPSAGADAPAIVLYAMPGRGTRIDIRISDGSAWLTQAQMAELFQTTVPNISIHLRGIFAEAEIDPAATVKSYLTVKPEGKRSVERDTKHYELSVVLAVGYRVRSDRGTQFRQWATEHLREYLIKGFVLDDERLKRPGAGLADHFDDLLERIRDIRASEQRMYLRVREIFALAADYQPKDMDTQVFFQIVQNKLHFAATGRTAPELIAERADHTQPNMGLSAFTGGVVRRRDVTVAKNFLRETEIAELNRIVVMFLDFAEDQARRQRQVFMRDWQSRLDDFLRFNQRDILPDAGRVSREAADRRALDEYAQFELRRRAEAEAAGAEDMLQELVASMTSLPGKKDRP